MRRFVVLVLAASLVSGCSAVADAGGPGATSPAPSRVEGLSGDLVQQRADVELGRIQVELTLDAAAAPLDLAGLQLRSGAFPGARPGGALLLQPGSTVDVPVVLGDPAACTPGEERDPSGESSQPLAATAVLSQRGGAGAVVDLPDADRHLARAHAEACTGAAAAAVVPTRWDPVWTTTGSGAGLRAVGVLHLGPVAAGSTAALEGVGATPLFAWRLPGGPVRLGAGQSADVTVVLEPARCDAHAVADDKRGFGPQLQLALDGAPTVPVRVWVPRPDRAVATGALLRACSAAP